MDNFYVFMEITKQLLKSEYKRPWGMMCLHYMNNNIPISHPYHSDVYQDEYKNRELYQEMNIFLDWNQKKNCRK